MRVFENEGSPKIQRNEAFGDLNLFQLAVPRGVGGGSVAIASPARQILTKSDWPIHRNVESHAVGRKVDSTPFAVVLLHSGTIKAASFAGKSFGLKSEESSRAP